MTHPSRHRLSPLRRRYKTRLPTRWRHSSRPQPYITCRGAPSMEIQTNLWLKSIYSRTVEKQVWLRSISSFCNANAAIYEGIWTREVYLPVTLVDNEWMSAFCLKKLDNWNMQKSNVLQIYYDSIMDIRLLYTVSFLHTISLNLKGEGDKNLKWVKDHFKLLP